MPPPTLRRRFIIFVIFVAITTAVLPILSFGLGVGFPWQLSADVEVEVAKVAVTSGDWKGTLLALKQTPPGSQIVLDARGDVSARLRALGSSLAIADGIHRSLLVIWTIDTSCSCRLSDLLAAPLPFALLELESTEARDALFRQIVPHESFLMYDYAAAAAEAGSEWISIEHELVQPVERAHLLFRTDGDLLNHSHGGWLPAAKQLGRLNLAIDAAPADDESSAPLATAQDTSRHASNSEMARPPASARWIGVHVCPSHVPAVDAQLHLPPALDWQTVRLLRDSGAVAGTQAAASASTSASASSPLMPHVTALPPRSTSCAAVRKSLGFVRSARALFFASPDDDEASATPTCGTVGVAAIGQAFATISKCADPCCCESACIGRKRCVAWQFYFSRGKRGHSQKSHCYLKKSPGLGGAPGNWGGQIDRQRIKSSTRNKPVRNTSRGGVTSCYEQQAALQANLAPWLHLGSARAGSAGSLPLSHTMPASQPTVVYWLRRSGLHGGVVGQAPEVAAMVQRAVFAAPDGAQEPATERVASARISISALMQLSPIGPVGKAGKPHGGGHAPDVLEAIASGSWTRTVHALRRSLTSSSAARYVVVDAKNGLGNRLRAIASAMAFARSTWRPLLVLWAKDRHCDCSFGRLFASPLPFALLEVDVQLESVPTSVFEISDYMDPSKRSIPVSMQSERHVYFRSGYLMSQLQGSWAFAQSMLQQLKPAAAVERMLVTNRSMVGVHVRTVFDAPLTAGTSASGDGAKGAAVATTGKAALALAEKEYGGAATRSLLLWRNASRWGNFVSTMKDLLRDVRAAKRGEIIPQSASQLRQAASEVGGTSGPLFYVAADSSEAYDGIMSALPRGMVVITRRQCAAERCDLRDCEAMVYSLVDMLNLARTRMILGSSWSSYSEVAAYWGGEEGEPLDLLQAGKDFGEAPPT